MNTYSLSYTPKDNKGKLDRNKRNLLIIGSANNSSYSKIITNPMNFDAAVAIYGKNNPLVDSYKLAFDITKDTNIYLVNCPMITDFIEIIDTIMHYDFNYIVPIDIYIDDTFINPITEQKTYFCDYYMERLGLLESLSTLIMTDRPSYLYESIDAYLLQLKKAFKAYYNKSEYLLEKFGSNMVFVLNNLENIYYSNVILAALLSQNTFVEYLDSVPFKTHFDIDGFDLNNINFSYFKHHKANNTCTVENLKNLRTTDDIYKWVLIDETIKYVIRHLDLDEFRGRFYSPYVQLQIQTRIKSIMNNMQGVIFNQFFIESIRFIKTEPTAGYINIHLSIVPFGTVEKINVVMGV